MSCGFLQPFFLRINKVRQIDISVGLVYKKEYSEKVGRQRFVSRYFFIYNKQELLGSFFYVERKSNGFFWKIQIPVWVL